MKDGQLTVVQLIEKLKALPQDLPVLSDGCDCYGETLDAYVVKNGDGWDEESVLISRSKQ